MALDVTAASATFGRRWHRLRSAQEEDLTACAQFWAICRSWRSHETRRHEVTRALAALWRALIEGQVAPLTRWTLGPLLAGLSYPYDWGYRLRLQAYRSGWATVNRLPCRVISVGNLTLGGTGKTPMVEAIATVLHRHGARVAVLSRGYGGTQRQAITIVSDGARCLVSPDVAGDEPSLLAERLTGIPVLVAQNRFAAGKLAVERFDVEVIVLDDGFQHVQLARDLDIVLLDASRPFGTGRLFPRGDLRESPMALARAHIIVLTRWTPGGQEAPWIPLPPLTPIYRSRHEPSTARVLQDGRVLPLTALRGRRLVAFCGIAMPEDFHRMLQRLGAVVVAFHPFPDHHPYTRRELEALSRAAGQLGAEVLVTTEKDSMRLRGIGPSRWPVWTVHIQCQIVDRRMAWEACLLGVVGRSAAGTQGSGNGEG
jgi:tetraacyldisaccharide 4'-kinase